MKLNNNLKIKGFLALIKMKGFVVKENYYKQAEILYETHLAKEDGEGILSNTALKESDDVYAIVEQSNDNVIAYIAFSKNKGVGEKDDFLYNQELKPYFYIEQILVAENYRRLGCGDMLINIAVTFEIVTNEEDIQDLYSHVSVLNHVSLKYHLKNGYEIVGLYKDDLFHGVKNYKSLLLKKDLNILYEELNSKFEKDKV